ncbi:MAG: serine hydrolase [Chitinophagaceae bacterium]|nr:serine hydrolase [Chitinophagaceae bacterium]
MKKIFVCFFAFFSTLVLQAQYHSLLSQSLWVDSVFNTLNEEQRIAQLMIIRAHSNLGTEHIQQVTDQISKYNVGGLCFFQGGPVRQANLTNQYQALTKTPLLISIDGEWGLGMRLDSVINFPRQLMIGAVPDAKLAYTLGNAIGQQCKRLGIQMNFAPDVDINNNPENPVINDRSFGEDKYRVALFGTQFMKGMQDVGVMACAKHFPGHGDVAVDSHFDLPVINKTREALDTLELYPFRQLIKEGVGSVMSAHLYIPSIDTTANQATSLSYNNVTGLLKNELGYTGLTITDGLEMQGVTKYYPGGSAAVQSLLAGNDLLLLPTDVPGTIAGVMGLIKEGKLNWDDLNSRVKKVLAAKYQLGLNQIKSIATENLLSDLNEQTAGLTQLLANNAITLLRQTNNELLPLATSKKIAYLAVGVDSLNFFGKTLQHAYGAEPYFFDYKNDMRTVSMLAATLKEKYDIVVIGMHNYNRRPANNFGISKAAIDLINLVQKDMPSITFAFGNPYAIKNIDNAPNLVACYEDMPATQQAAIDLLNGQQVSKGKLTVTVSDSFHYGAGNNYNYYFPPAAPETVGINAETFTTIDSIANDAIAKHATPGCVVLVAKDGKIAFEKSYGYTNYDSLQPVNNNMIYDLASVTKVSATTVSVMKLYEEGRLQLDKTLGDYLPWVRGSNKAGIKLRNLLLHQAGLVAYIPFYKETVDSTHHYKPGIFSSAKTSAYSIRVAEDLYMSTAYRDTMYKKILESKLSAPNKYIYSDNDFIFLGKVVEAITGKPLEDYVRETFYLPLRMMSTSFTPREHYPINGIAPAENDTVFRKQLLRGDVHDPGAAMFGGVAGHAGLFSNAYDLAQLYQLLLNGGELHGVRLLKKKTINYFTAYHSKISRRGLGFDKPEKDNATRPEPYPTKSASSKTFGHTGYTGTCVWVDPKYKLVYIFLSNRVTPDDQPKLLRLNVRSNIHEAIYKGMKG